MDISDLLSFFFSFKFLKKKKISVPFGHFKRNASNSLVSNALYVLPGSIKGFVLPELHNGTAGGVLKK